MHQEQCLAYNRHKKKEGKEGGREGNVTPRHFPWLEEQFRLKGDREPVETIMLKSWMGCPSRLHVEVQAVPLPLTVLGAPQDLGSQHGAEDRHRPVDHCQPLRGLA